MQDDDQELIRRLKSALDDGTEPLRYNGQLPLVATTARTRHLVAAAAAAVVAIVGVSSFLTVQNVPGRPEASTASASPTSSPHGGIWVADDALALSNALANPERLRTDDPAQDPGGTGRPNETGGSFELCMPTDGSAEQACGAEARPPYPFVFATAPSVPSTATRFPDLDDYGDPGGRAWVADDSVLGGTVWFQFADQGVFSVSSEHFRTGEELAQYLLEQPVGR